jgi:hypothetical protein
MYDSGQDLINALQKQRGELVDAVNDMKSSGRFLCYSRKRL